MRAAGVQFTIAWSLLCTFATAADVSLPPVKLGAVRREPVAAIFWNNDLAAIACAKSGTLIFWDIARGEIAQEFQVGKQLRGVARFGDDELLVIDDKTHELIHLQFASGKLSVLSRYAVPNAPVSLFAFSVLGKDYCAIASLWARQITVWRREGAKLKSGKPRDLPFEPRCLNGHLLTVSHNADLDDMTLVVAAAFGNEVAESSAKFGNVRILPATLPVAHNIGGIGDHPEEGWIRTQQIQAAGMPVTELNLIEGRVLVNRLAHLDGRKLFPDEWLGRIGRDDERFYDHNADPAGISFTKNGMLVCLAGVDEVWYQRRRRLDEYERIPVGKRPRVIITREEVSLVLGELDDSISRIETKDPENPLVTKSLLDPALANRELSPAERGERLFFDARMSAGGRMSCHSCHTDGHTNGLLADTLGDNTHGTPKRVLTLRGTRLTDLWSWNGEMKTLQDNVFKSLKETMHAPEIKPADVDDIVSFLHTLPPVPPLKPVPTSDADRAQLARGEKIFQRENCGSCHVPPLTFTSHAVYDVGLADEKGLRKFNPPSLRGVGRLKKLFHDNRASSLRDVFETHGHQLAEPLPASELSDLVRYLESL